MSGQKAKVLKQYKYAQQLSFLTKFFEERETMSNIDDEVEKYENTNEVDVDESEQDESEENSQSCTTELVNPVNIDTQSHCIPSNTKQRESFQIPTPRKKTKLSVSDAPPSKTAAATVMEYLVNQNKNMTPLQPQHPVDAFLAGISPVLKKLPPRYWHYAKADIFATVQNYEFKQIMDQEQLAEPSPTSNYSTSSYSEQPSPAAFPSPHHPSTSGTISSSDKTQDHSLQHFYQNFVQ